MKGGFVGKKTEKRMFCYTVLLTAVKKRMIFPLRPFDALTTAL